MRTRHLLASFVMAVAVAVVPTAARAQGATIVNAGGPDAVPGSYIVVLKDAKADVPAIAARLTGRYGGSVTRTFEPVLPGFAVRADERQAGQIAGDDLVDWVEQDQRYHAQGVELNPPWGLDRIDQANMPLDKSYAFPQPMPNGGGYKVKIYVLDTGIRITHKDFDGRAEIGTDTVNDGWSGLDCHGHGTHVAGTAGGWMFGVAKYSTLVSVRVLDCLGDGTTNGVLAGIQWVTKNSGGKGVANMSLGGPASPAMDNAVNSSINAGTVYVVAAGNDGIDACTQSPARVPRALTIGATDSSDKRAVVPADFWASNFGECVDLFAPGVGIASASNADDTGSAVAGGTSMAAPHVAGLAAMHRSSFPLANPDQTAGGVVVNSTAGVVGDPKGPNRLAFVAPFLY
jgi:subtilisin family serine protease